MKGNEKLLFGSDFPFSTIGQAAARLGRAVAPCHRFGIADITNEDVSAICSRDTLRLLDLDPAGPLRASP